MGPAANDTQACLPRDPSSSAEEMASRALSITPTPRKRSKKAGCIIWPLVPLRAAIFLFFGGLGCLLIFLPLHMREVGLSDDYTRLVSCVAPFFSLLGPLIVGPSADRLGKHKVLLTACLLLSAATYCLLLAVPVSAPQGATLHQQSLLPRPPAVRLRCDPKGAAIIQEKCANDCPAWGEHQSWEVEIRDCRVDCEDPYASQSTEDPSTTDTTDVGEIENPGGGIVLPTRSTTQDRVNQSYPHLCFGNETSNEGGGYFCAPFNSYSRDFFVNVSLPEVASLDAECHYPLTGSRIRTKQSNRTYSSLQCRAPGQCPHFAVYCELRGKLWDVSSDGHQLCPAPLPFTDPSVTLWSYLLARSVADIFPAAAVPLINTLVVVLARDHHSDVGRELSWGALGAGILVPAVCALEYAEITPWPETPSALPILVFAFLSLLAAAALSGVKLQPAWYSRRMELGGNPGPNVSHKGEAVGLLLVLLVLGIFWGALDTYLPWFYVDSGHPVIVLGLSVTVGCLVAFPLLWNSERLIEYCGHTNLFIVAFAFYIIRFTGYGFMDSAWLGFAFEVFEVFTLCLMWVSAVVYVRHLSGKHLTATAQAAIFLAHFCLGRFIGALIGAEVTRVSNPWTLYQSCALGAALLGWFYFSIYHCCMRPRCGRKKTYPPGSSEGATDGVTSNGSYTPLRIYNGDQKRQRRY